MRLGPCVAAGLSGPVTFRRRKAGGGAFTLIELLVVVAIIALLVSILMPSLRMAKELARRSVCAGNLRSMHQGMFLYLEDYQDMPGRAYDTPYDRKVYRGPAPVHGGTVSLGLLNPQYYSPKEGYWCPSVGHRYQNRTVQYWLDAWQDESLDEIDIPYMYRRMTDISAWPTVTNTLFREDRTSLLLVSDVYYADSDQPPNHAGGRNNAYWGGYVLWYDDPNDFWWYNAYIPYQFTHGEFFEEMDLYGGT